MRLQVHGARGSAPVSGVQYLRYGGYTTCFELTSGDGHRIIVDCGSGLRRLEAGYGGGPLEATVFLTHFHWDHIQGLPFFAPLFEANTRLRLVALPPEGWTALGALSEVLRPPWFPKRLDEVDARLSAQPLPADGTRVGNVEVRGVPLAHPGGVMAYRFSEGGRSLVIATDTEAGDASSDAALRQLAAGATVLVHDAQYTPEEHAANRRGWGHSTWADAAHTAAAAGVERLVLTSHDPGRTDDEVDAIVARARSIFPNTVGAHEGQVLEI